VFGLVIGFIGLLNNSWLNFKNHYHTHTQYYSQPRCSLLCLVTSSNSGRSSASVLTISHQSPTLLIAASRLCRIGSQSSLYSPCTDRTENVFHYCVLARCRGNNMSKELFPSNGCYAASCLHSCHLAMGPHITICITISCYGIMQTEDHFGSIWLKIRILRHRVVPVSHVE
jgi:hypothetical protein